MTRLVPQSLPVLQIASLISPSGYSYQFLATVGAMEPTDANVGMSMSDVICFCDATDQRTRARSCNKYIGHRTWDTQHLTVITGLTDATQRCIAMSEGIAVTGTEPA